jgi:hypothetical protein
MLKLKIELGEDYKLNLSANNMNELVDKIIEWQLWENQPLELFEKKGVLEKERKCNWYYFKK